MADNILYYGDNLDILKLHIDDKSVDLVYLDPPFNSNATYNILFKEVSGTQATAQIKAFDDTWHWDQSAAAVYQDTVELGGQVSQTMQAFRMIMGESTLLAYLAMMAPRLVQLRRVMKPSASIYLHCDPTASHYLKMLMDAVFGAENFQNEIIWHYRKWPSGKYAFQRNHDIILFYARSSAKEKTFNQLYMDRAASTIKRFGSSKIVSGHDEQGRRIPSQTEESESAGVRQDDVWEIGRVPPIKQLYPTQKPLSLLERIILASSNPGDVVLDPFCGCGTAVVEAQHLGRRWIGIDITHLAVTVMKHRLWDSFGKDLPFQVVGEPVSVPDAQVLAASDPYQFQWWALGLVGARPAEGKKGADKGIDGRLYFHDEGINGKTKQVIFSVKAGHASVNHMRDLHGVLDREGAEIGVLITMEEPTRSMRTETASAGYYEAAAWGTRHPRLQLLTVAELLGGKTIDMPPSHSNVSFKKAEPVKKNDKTLGLDMPKE